jgi:mRNA-degrading endonuclease RelE of RelBE toxin-antitoxin system
MTDINWKLVFDKESKKEWKDLDMADRETVLEMIAENLQEFGDLEGGLSL